MAASPIALFASLFLFNLRATCSFESSPEKNLRRHKGHHGLVEDLLGPRPQVPMLLFWAVSSEQRVIDMVQKNVEHARATGGSGCCDVFLAHYDGKADRWPQEWYKSEVSQAISSPGFKFQLLQKAYKASGKQWETKYSYVWVLDEDMDLENTDMNKVLKLANTSNSFIMGPSLQQSEGHITWRIQEPDPACAFRYTNYVEVIAPIVRASALHTILEDCDRCIHEETVWGLDGVWCRFTGSRLRPTDPTSACAILDDTPVLHRNWKTLKGKYTKTKSGVFPGLARGNFQVKGDHDAKEVKKLHPGLYVESSAQTTLRCLRADGTVVSNGGGNPQLAPQKKKSKKHHDFSAV